MANPPPMLPGLGFPVDSKIDLLRKWTWNTWLWAQEDFQPSDIPGLGLWLDAYSLNDSLGYLDSVSLWPDESGNSRDATQSTGANQPRFLPCHGINYFHLPNVAGNYVSRPIADNTYDYVVTYEDGTTALGTKATTAGQWLFGVGDSDFAGKQVARVQLSLAGTLVSDLIANDANANNTTIPDRISGTWTINRSGANPARIVSAPAVLFDGTDDYMSILTGLDLFRAVSGATVFAVVDRTSSITATSSFVYSGGISTTGVRVQVSGPQGSYIVRLGGRRLDANVFQVLEGQTYSYGERIVQGARFDYTNAEASNILNGNIQSPQAFQTAGNTSNTDSLAATVGRVPDTVSSFWFGAISQILAYRRALTDAEIMQLSRYLAARANAGIVI